MSGQSISRWIVDPVWTGQVESNGTRDTPGLAAIKAQPESTSPQQPESSSISMPPKTRSQTGRSRPPNSPSLATLEEELRNLDVEGDSRRSPQPPSPDYDPADERREAEGLVETRTTPKIRKKTRTVTSSQKDLARSADPNGGRCLITNRPNPVQSCHLVAQATDHETLTKLEYAWGLKYRYFNVDTRYNMMHLRNDWHFLFDQSEWFLVPEAEVLQKLSKLYLEDKCATSDITKLFVEPAYRYYVLPAPTLEEPICRFSDVNSHEHKTHFPPFPNLGLLTSHIHPHFVIFNTGKKLSSTQFKDVSDMMITLSQTVPPSSNALTMVITIQRLYTAWTELQVPDHFCDTIGTPNRLHRPSEEGQDDRSQGGPPPRRQGLRSVTRSQGQGTQASASHYEGGRQRAVLPFQAPEDDDSSSVTDDTVVEGDTSWIEYIYNWQKQGKGVAESWESDVFHDSCDEQLAAYTDEHARTPPSPGAWNSWKPTWDDHKSRYPNASDRAQFSSNDWAVFKNDVYLTRPDDPRVTT